MICCELFSHIFDILRFKYIRIQNFQSYSIITWALMFVIMVLISALYVPAVFMLIYWLFGCTVPEGASVPEQCAMFQGMYLELRDAYWQSHLSGMFPEVSTFIATCIVVYILLRIGGFRERFWALLTIGTGVTNVGGIITVTLLYFLWWSLVFAESMVMHMTESTVLLINMVFMLLCLVVYIFWIQRIIHAVLHLSHRCSYVLSASFCILVASISAVVSAFSSDGEYAFQGERGSETETKPAEVVSVYVPEYRVSEYLGASLV